MNLDDLELELRRLPGVRAAGFEDSDGLLLVQIHVTADAARDDSIPVSATRVAARHADRPVAVEVIRWRDTDSATYIESPLDTQFDDIQPTRHVTAEPGSRVSRPRLLAVIAFPDSDELEVHIMLGDRRTIGRAASADGLVGAANATLAAVASLGINLDVSCAWARPVDRNDSSSLTAVCLILNGDERYGLASGSSPIDGAARATLDALNRRISLILQP